MTKILEELKQELTKKLPDNQKIDLLITQAKAEDHSLSQTIELYYNVDHSALELAIYYENAYAIEALVKEGADINKPNNKDLTPLQYAAKKDKTKAIEALLKLGVAIDQVNKNGQTALHIASKNNKILAIRALLKDNADSTKEIINHPDKNDQTALHIAVNENFTNAIVVLAMNGADVNQADKNGQTPFHLVFKNEPTSLELQGHKTNSIKFLMTLGADVNKADNSGETPLHFALRYNQTDQVIKALLEANADVNKANNVGTTPFSIAVENDQIDLIKLFLRNGANYDQFRSTDNSAFLAEINKIDKTKEVFAGNLSILVEEIDEEYLQYLCKQSGIPDHLLKTDQDNPNSLAYIDIVKKFQTPPNDIKDDLNVFLGLLLNSDNKNDFPAISGFDYIFISDFNIDENSKKTIESYQQKPYLKPENFLKDKYLEDKISIFARNKEKADNFFFSN